MGWGETPVRQSADSMQQLVTTNMVNIAAMKGARMMAMSSPAEGPCLVVFVEAISQLVQGQHACRRAQS